MIRVSQIMRKEVVFVRPGSSIVAARRLMRDFNIRHLPVVERGMLAGIVSDGDIMLASHLRDGRIDVPDDPVSVIMSRNVVSCFPTSLIQDVAATMIRLQISCVPVAIESKLIGIVTSTDILRMLASTSSITTGIGNGTGIDLEMLRPAG
jgi:acetoin utilization protein AcuB